MAKKKTDKAILLLTEEHGDIVDTLLSLEPGPVYLLGTETIAGPGVYLCDQEFTIEEAEQLHGFNPDEEVIDDDIEVEVPLDELE